MILNKHAVEDLGASLVLPEDVREDHVRLVEQLEKNRTAMQEALRAKYPLRTPPKGANATVLKAVENRRKQHERAASDIDRFITGQASLLQTRVDQVASWAVWNRTEDSTEDALWFQRDTELNAAIDSGRVHARVVFIGLNAGNAAADIADQPAPWSTFHGGQPAGRRGSASNGNIKLLSEPLRDASDNPRPVWGAYMTDFYKNLPTSDWGAIKKIRSVVTKTVSKKAWDDLEKHAVQALRAELRAVGATPETTCLVPMGKGAAHCVARCFPEWTTHNTTHYSAYTYAARAREDYADVAARHSHGAENPCVPARR